MPSENIRDFGRPRRVAARVALAVLILLLAVIAGTRLSDSSVRAQDVPPGAPSCDPTEFRFAFPSTEAPASRVINLGGEVVLTVLRGETAAFNNQVTIAAPTNADLYMSKNQPEGARFFLGTFAADTELIMQITTPEARTYQTGPGSRNPDGLVHANVVKITEGVFWVGWEDLFNGGDRDYDDVFFLICGNLISDDEFEDDLSVEERFTYPESFEKGATVFREFRVWETETGNNATGVTANLFPNGECSQPSAERLRCTIETRNLPLGSTRFTFFNALHNGNREESGDWPNFTFNLVDRDIRTRAQMTGTGGGSIGLGVSLSASGAGGFAVELEKDATVIEGTRADTFGASVDFGFGAGVKLGVVEPRASAKVTLGGELSVTRTVGLRLTDLTDAQQQRALATWLLTSAFEPALEPNPLLDAVYTALLGQSLRSNYTPFISKDSFGVTYKSTASGSLGVFLAQRPNFDPFNFGLGTSGGAAGSLSWEFDRKENKHAISYRADLTAALTFTPTTQLEMFFGEDPLGLDIPNFGATGAAGMVVKFVFAGTPSPSALDALSFEFVWGDTLDQQLTNNSLTISFDGTKLRQVGGRLWAAFEGLLDPDSINQYTPVLLLGSLAIAIDQVEGEVILKTTRGTGFAPTFALGGEIALGIKAELGLSIGGEWLLTVTQQTDHWIIQKGSLVKVSEFDFTPTNASENTITTIISDALTELVDSVDVTALLSGAWSSTTEFVTTQATAATEAILTIPQTVTEFVVSTGNIRTGLDVGIRLVTGLASGFLQTPTLRTAQLATDFLQSDLVELSPVGATADAPFSLSITYASAFAGDPADLKIFLLEDDGLWRALPTIVDQGTQTLTAQTSTLGYYVAGWDTRSPVTADVLVVEGFTVLAADDASGVDPTTATLTADGVAVPLTFDPFTGRFTATTPIAPGANVVFRVADGAGNSTSVSTETTSAQRVVPLAPGWNLVGWSGATPIEEAIASVTADLTSLFTWDAAADEFLSFRPGQPAFLNTLAELSQDDGVWLLTTNGGEWSQPPINGARTVQLLDGFNLVMWTGPDGSAVADAVAPLGSALEALYVWDADQQQFLLYSPNQPAFLNTATTLQQGAGVWIRVNRGTPWTQPTP